MTSDALRRAQRRYINSGMQLRLFYCGDKDADIMEKLSKVPNKTDYVRKLIREDINRES